MKNLVALCSIIAMTFCLSGCQSIWYIFLSSVVDIAPDRFILEESNSRLSIPVFTSHPFDKSSKGLKRVIVIIHGSGLNAEKSFETGLRIVDKLGEDRNDYMVIAPQFLEGIEPEERGLLFWGRQWRSGGVSLSEKINKDLPGVSSYQVMDRLIEFVTDKNPNIHKVIVLGHSAGGQFVSRYAAINNNHEDFKKQGISMYYVVANPSSYLYLDSNRFRLGSNGEILKRPRDKLVSCKGYDNYKYGLANRYGYAKGVSGQDIQTRLLSRPIIFLLGQKDTERSWSLDKSCEVEVQGENRYERGMLYKHHLQSFVIGGVNSTHQWLVLPDIGHDSNEMFTHDEVVKSLGALLD